MSIGKQFLGFFKSKPQVLSKLASTIDHNVPYYRIHGTFPDNGLPMRGNFDRVTIEALANYISGNKPLITYGGTVDLDVLFTGFLKDKKIENGMNGLIVGVAERVIELSSLYEPLVDHFTDLNPEATPKKVANFVKKHEAIIESLPEERIIAYITDLKDFLEGEIVKNHFANVNSQLPPTVTIHELQDSDFIRDLWEDVMACKDTLKNEY
ncbi:hypothetical protein DGG96_07505 [Legionella qingyii]|uniref:Uncharacterized protein n=1 Tax=Legionella qingyii TaxID=2184757 RepID=A0A317U461_9GAMM|nr:hypothetical protein [Legionella qingyii]PWY56179.1 hypothetical protein DGG96_07505 [Legionella qingyii]RUR22207.1 hypothetical protein ELY20_09880 [Legionella qingyii]RUR25801.1 hypothetical protein ELY16_09120 [Legionella qingyii]